MDYQVANKSVLLFLQAGVWARAFMLPMLILIIPIAVFDWDSGIVFALWPFLSLTYLIGGYFVHKKAEQNDIEASLERTKDPKYVSLLKQAGYSIYPIADTSTTCAPPQTSKTTLKSDQERTNRQKTEEASVNNPSIKTTATTLVANTALTHSCVHSILNKDERTDAGHLLFATAIIDTASYWKQRKISKSDLRYAVELAKAGIVCIGSYQFSHCLTSSDSETELLYNLAMQLLAMKLYADNDFSEEFSVNTVINLKSKIISTIDSVLTAGNSHPEYRTSFETVNSYMQREDFQIMAFGHPFELNTTHIPNPTVTDQPNPKTENIDLSGLTDEQKKLVTQLVKVWKTNH